MPKNRVFLYTCLILMAGLSACASPEAVREMSKGKTIAVASEVGDELSLAWIGTTIFQNEDTKLPGWDLDGIITDAAVKNLQKTGRFQRVFAAKAEKTTWSVAVPKGADFLLYITPAKGPYMLEYMKSVGVTRRTMFGTEGHTEGHVILFANLFDASASSVTRTYMPTIWEAKFQLESGPKIPDGEVQKYKAENAQKIQETVAKILEKMGLAN